jgi:hypothetical protein
MGTLVPGATYIYENDGQKIYAREIGSTDRQLVGETMDRVYQQRADDFLWRQIRIESETNPTLKDALDRVLMIYKLSQNNG